MEKIIKSDKNPLNFKQLYMIEKEKRKNIEKELENKNNEIQYLFSKLKIHENTHNKGEKDEVLILIKLFYMNEKKQYDKLIDIFGDEASNGIQIICINTNNIITDINKLSKTSSKFKADCIIKMIKNNYKYYISIKSNNGAPPAIINHTPKTAKVFQQNGILYNYIKTLDIIMKEYIEKRTAKIISEDISITELKSFNNNHIRLNFMNILSYFIFNGSGKGNSKFSANSIINYIDNKIVFIKCRDIEEKDIYIQTIYNKIIISLRDKGMPKNIKQCNHWLYKDYKPDNTIKYKGSLHIRIK